MAASTALAKLETELALATTVAELTQAIQAFGREIVGAEGITVVLRAGDHCFYAEEAAIAPLWKGQRFPIDECVSGWAMRHRQAVIIPNIFLDPRVPQDVYRRTFVKSLMIVPVDGPDRATAAIGAYWAEFHDPTDQERLALYSLARLAAHHMTRLQA